MAITTHLLAPGDLAGFRAMLSLFGEAFEDAATYTRNQPDDAYIRRLLSGDRFIGLIAKQDGKIAGALAAYELEKFEQARSEIYIYDLAVAEHHRRKGVATALITHTRTIARERGAWVIYVQADKDDTPSITLYSKLGKREDVLHFDISPEA